MITINLDFFKNNLLEGKINSFKSLTPSCESILTKLNLADMIIVYVIEESILI